MISSKHHIYPISGNSEQSIDEISTIASQNEEIMNSQPLCALSNDPSNLTCLITSKFLI